MKKRKPSMGSRKINGVKIYDPDKFDSQREAMETNLYIRRNARCAWPRKND